MTVDALVLGSGPAGLAAAAALASRGLTTTVLAPDPHAPWPATYGSWTDRLPERVRPAIAARWSRAWVHLDPVGPAFPLDRDYARLDTALLQAALLESALGAGARIESGVCRSVAHDAQGTTVEAGATRRCRVVVDCAGVALGGPAPTLFQTAWGILAETDGALDELRWMDFSHRFGDGTETPTFLYGLPMPDGRLFLEETSLAHLHGLPFEVLEDRLRLRLAALGIRVRRTVAVERCRIALDRPAPPPQRTIGFGAAAGMIHPATGFSVARILAQADPLADAIVSGLTDGGPDGAASAAWASLWPPDRRRRWSLYRYGARLLGTLGADQTRSFLNAFFRGGRWGEWLDDELSTGELAGQMMAHFARLPSGPRWRILRGSLRAGAEEAR